MRVRVVIAVIVCALVVAVAPAAARADTISVSATPAAPIDAADVTVTVSGSASHDASAVVYARPGGAGPCPAGPGDMGVTGKRVIDDRVSAGDFTLSTTPEVNEDGDFTFGFPEPGAWLLCGWLASSDWEEVFASTSVPVTVGPAEVQLRLDAPDVVAFDQHYQLRITAAARAPRTLRVDRQPAPSGPCPDRPEPSADTDNAVLSVDIGETSAAVYERTVNMPPVSTGVERLCAWVENRFGYVNASVSRDIRVLRVPGRWRFAGRTSQRLRMDVEGRGSYVHVFSAFVRYRCPPGSGLARHFRYAFSISAAVLGRSPITVGGTYALTYTHRRAAARIHMRRRGRRIAGTFRHTLFLREPRRPSHVVACTTGRVRFRLRPARP